MKQWNFAIMHMDRQFLRWKMLKIWGETTKWLGIFTNCRKAIVLPCLASVAQAKKLTDTVISSLGIVSLSVFPEQPSYCFHPWVCCLFLKWGCFILSTLFKINGQVKYFFEQEKNYRILYLLDVIVAHMKIEGQKIISKVMKTP